MSLSSLPLSYCTNVHPALSIEETCQGLETYTARVKDQLAAPLAAGLWLPRSALDQLVQNEQSLKQLQHVLNQSDLICYTLNAFPFGNFHSERVKEQVYLPDWTTPQRLTYTQDCASILSRLLPTGVEGSISTVPLGFKDLASGKPDFQQQCIKNLLALAQFLDELHDETGIVIRLAIEPEPLCVLETTPDTIVFFRSLFAEADRQGLEPIARRHLGVCYDVCHQAVEFEDISQSISAFRATDIRINKVHITCALHLDQPLQNPAARSQLAEFVENRYLHQTFARLPSGKIVSVTDLTRKLCENPEGRFAEAEAWRIHFHVPVNSDSVGLLGTTRTELQQALREVHRLQYAPHLEVETYTWGVLPGQAKPSLVDGLTQELLVTGQLLDELKTTPSGAV